MRGMFCAALLLTLVPQAFGQSKQAPPKAPNPPSERNIAPKTPPVQPKYLRDNLDLTATNLGPNFAGHDIVAMFTAINGAAALAPKSEFESTPEYLARRSKFTSGVLFGTASPTGYFGFIDDDSSIFGPQYSYDADSQTLAITIIGGNESFVVDKSISKFDGFQIRRVLVDSDTYVGSNAFGAKADIRKTFWQEYGIAFEDSWLFQSSGSHGRKFTFLVAMSPDQARTLKNNAKLLIVCRMSDPWFYRGAHGHDPTISEPYETLIGENYLRAAPEQVWLFDERTGDVIQKISEESFAAYQDQQMALRLKQTPLILEVFAPRVASFKVVVDDQPEESGYLNGETKTIAAKHRIVFTFKFPQSLSDLMFKLNGKIYTPSWTKDAAQIGRYETINSATFEIKVP